VLPLSYDSVEGFTHDGMAMPLSTMEVACQYFQQSTANSNQDPSLMKDDDCFPEHIWAQNSLNS
jgi:hypothetical protein